MSTVVPPEKAGQRPGPIPAYLARLVDDAAIFPPGNSPLPEAVDAHRGHREAAYADLVGPFVVGDTKLADLLEVSTRSTTRESDAGPLAVSVVVAGGAGAIEPAVRWATRSPALELRSLEIGLRGDLSELTHNAKRVVTVVDQLVAAGELDDEVPVYLEPPRLHDQPPGHGWLSALDEVAAMDHRLKFRTGGVEADAFPSSAELATCIGAGLDRELAFKCTAGLHRALRHRDADTGFEHHGFLNVLLATRVSLDGAPAEEVAGVLETHDADSVLGRLRDLEQEQLASTRRWFTSFGSCSVLEPWQDVVDLSLSEPKEA